MAKPPKHHTVSRNKSTPIGTGIETSSTVSSEHTSQDPVAAATGPTNATLADNSEINYVEPSLYPSSSDDRPITFGHLKAAWIVIGVVVTVFSTIALGIWYFALAYSNVETKLEGLDKGSKGMADKIDVLSVGSARSETRLENLDRRVSRLESKADQTTTRAR